MDTDVAVRIYTIMKEYSKQYYQEHKDEILRKKRERYAERRKDVEPARRGRPPKKVAATDPPILS
jgi:hypothetical protein